MYVRGSGLGDFSVELSMPSADGPAESLGPVGEEVNSYAGNLSFNECRSRGPEIPEIPDSPVNGIVRQVNGISQQVENILSLVTNSEVPSGPINSRSKRRRQRKQKANKRRSLENQQPQPSQDQTASEGESEVCEGFQDHHYTEKDAHFYCRDKSSYPPYKACDQDWCA